MLIIDQCLPNSLVFPMTFCPWSKRSRAGPSASSSPSLLNKNESRSLRWVHEADMHYVWRVVYRPKKGKMECGRSNRDEPGGVKSANFFDSDFGVRTREWRDPRGIHTRTFKYVVFVFFFSLSLSMTRSHNTALCRILQP